MTKRPCRAKARARVLSKVFQPFDDQRGPTATLYTWCFRSLLSSYPERNKRRKCPKMLVSLRPNEEVAVVSERAEANVENLADFREGGKYHVPKRVAFRRREFAADVAFPPQRPFVWANSSRGMQSNYWSNYSAQDLIDALRERIEKHAVQPSKDGYAIYPGRLPSGKRDAKNVERVECVVADLDHCSRREIERTLHTLDAADIYYLAHTTYSHRSGLKEVPGDEFMAVARESGLFPLDTVEKMNAAARLVLPGATGMALNEMGEPRLFEQSAKGGSVCVVLTPEVEKWRVWMFLDQPYLPSHAMALGFSESDARGRLWKAGLKKFFAAMNIPADVSCFDLPDAYYRAACPPHLSDKAEVVTGKGRMCISLDAIVPKTMDELDALVPAKPQAKVKLPTNKSAVPRDTAPKKHPLSGWMARYGKSFDVEAVMDSRGLVKSERPTGGKFIECDREDVHQVSEQRTYCQNGDGDKYFTLHCTGGTNACSERDRLDRLQGYIDAGKIDIADLELTAFGGGPVGGKPSKDAIRASHQGADARIHVRRSTIDHRRYCCHRRSIVRQRGDCLNRRGAWHEDEDETQRSDQEGTQSTRS